MPKRQVLESQLLRGNGVNRACRCFLHLADKHTLLLTSRIESTNEYQLVFFLAISSKPDETIVEATVLAIRTAAGDKKLAGIGPGCK